MARLSASDRRKKRQALLDAKKAKNASNVSKGGGQGNTANRKKMQNYSKGLNADGTKKTKTKPKTKTQSDPGSLAGGGFDSAKKRYTPKKKVKAVETKVSKAEEVKVKKTPPKKLTLAKTTSTNKTTTKEKKTTPKKTKRTFAQKKRGMGYGGGQENKAKVKKAIKKVVSKVKSKIKEKSAARKEKLKTHKQVGKPGSKRWVKR